MDPNALSSLDPKLRETYERVMGANANSAPPPGAPPAADASPTTTAPVGDAAPQPQPGLSTTPTPEQTPSSASPDANAAAPVDPSQDQPKVVTITQSLPNPTPELQVAQPHGHAGLIKVFYVLGTAVFFVIYIFFWMKIFNFQLPV